MCSKWRIVYVEEVVGEVEALGSVGQGGSFFEDGGYGDVGKAGGYGLPFFMGSEVGVEDGLGLGFHSESGEGLSASDGVGDLYGEDAFAESGVGEEEAYLNRGRLMLWLCHDKKKAPSQH